MVGISGIVFYFVASGCATFDYGAVKTEVKGSPQLYSSARIRSIFVSLESNSGDKGFLESLKGTLKHDGYDIVDNPNLADLQLNLIYQSFPTKVNQMNIFFGVPIPSSYNGSSAEVEAIFITRDHRFERSYRAQYVYIVSDKLVADVKSMNGVR